MTTNQTPADSDTFGVVPVGGEFAVTNMRTGQVVSYWMSRSEAEVVGLANAAEDAAR